MDPRANEIQMLKTECGEAFLCESKIKKSPIENNEA